MQSRRGSNVAVVYKLWAREDEEETSASAPPPSMADDLTSRRHRNYQMLLSFSTDYPWNPYKALVVAVV